MGAEDKVGVDMGLETEVEEIENDEDHSGGEKKRSKVENKREGEG
jgi:hypothetical protein